MPEDNGGDRVSQNMMEYLSGLSLHEREELTAMLRHPKTFLAEDVDDLMAILHSLKNQ